MRFALFRISVHADYDLFFQEERSHEEVLREAVRRTPIVEVRKNHRYAIGNLVDDDGEAFAFAFGNIRKKKTSVFDPKTHRFHDDILTEGDCLRVVMDPVIELCAIEVRRVTTMPSAQTISRYLGKVLSDDVHDVSLAALHDTSSLVEFICKAHELYSLRVTVKRPNPHDTDDVNDALERTVEALQADKCHSHYTGDLKKDEVRNTVLSVASTGGKVRIGAKDEAGTKRSRSSGKDLYTVDIEDPATDESSPMIVNWARQAIATFRREYRKIRGDLGEGP